MRHWNWSNDEALARNAEIWKRKRMRRCDARAEEAMWSTAEVLASWCILMLIEQEAAAYWQRHKNMKTTKKGGDDLWTELKHSGEHGVGFTLSSRCNIIQHFIQFKLLCAPNLSFAVRGNGRGNLRKNEMKSEIEIRPCWTRSAPTEKETIENRLYPQFSHH